MAPAELSVKTIFQKLFESFQRLSHGSSIARRFLEGSGAPNHGFADTLPFSQFQRAEEQPRGGSAVPVESPSILGRTSLRTVRSLMARRPYGKVEPVRQWPYCSKFEEAAPSLRAG
jgi:hypothetical protein